MSEVTKENFRASFDPKRVGKYYYNPSPHALIVRPCNYPFVSTIQSTF